MTDDIPAAAEAALAALADAVAGVPPARRPALSLRLAARAVEAAAFAAAEDGDAATAPTLILIASDLSRRADAAARLDDREAAG
ncbi:hypothetical protein JQC91_11145 [Jannaschia sp. Os4]|uniref:hypothetical protein n=1 Tax=Jannaschia sp. Os4 TaxID=2807617 RepID=UPI00193AC0CC|nr:hypothetical protein [Jannaschia sp. Os4]MBM2576857.1 hypothetical protein [Jannaschia sp. Os4]